MKMLVVALSLLLAPSVWAQSSCQYVFQKTKARNLPPGLRSWTSQYTVQTNGMPMQKGQVSVGDAKGTVLGAVEYTVTSGAVYINRVSGVSLEAQSGIYSVAVKNIQSRNPNMKTIITSIAGDYFKIYKEDMARGLTEEQALFSNPVYQELAAAGFSQVNLASEMGLNGPSFVRLSVSRTDF